MVLWSWSFSNCIQTGTCSHPLHTCMYMIGNSCLGDVRLGVGIPWASYSSSAKIPKLLPAVGEKAACAAILPYLCILSSKCNVEPSSWQLLFCSSRDVGSSELVQFSSAKTLSFTQCWLRGQPVQPFPDIYIYGHWHVTTTLWLPTILATALLQLQGCGNQWVWLPTPRWNMLSLLSSTCWT